MMCTCGHPQAFHTGMGRTGRCIMLSPRCWCAKYKEEPDDPSPHSRSDRDTNPAPAVVPPTLGASVYEAMFPEMYGENR